METHPAQPEALRTAGIRHCRIPPQIRAQSWTDLSIRQIRHSPDTKKYFLATAGVEFTASRAFSLPNFPAHPTYPNPRHPDSCGSFDAFGRYKCGTYRSLQRGNPPVSDNVNPSCSAATSPQNRYGKQSRRLRVPPQGRYKRAIAPPLPSLAQRSLVPQYLAFATTPHPR